MNKSVLVEELNNIGIIITSFEFSEAGYIIELKLNPEKAVGWEELEHLPVVGLELAKSRPIGEYRRKVLFIPSNNKGFKEYVIKHMKYFGLGKSKALDDLEETVLRFGSKYTKTSVADYLKRNRKKVFKSKN